MRRSGLNSSSVSSPETRRADLVAELRHALAHELRVELVVAVHGSGGLGVLPLPGSGERAGVRGGARRQHCRMSLPLTLTLSP